MGPVTSGMMLAICCLVIGGCGAAALPARTAANSQQEIWVSRNGGIVADARSARVATIASALVQGQPAIPIHVQVLNSAQASAFAWPDGNIYVTRALVDLLDNQELEAALAHEMGHLLNDGKLAGLAALRGAARADCESAADASGCQLLQSRGKPVAAMTSMLEKVMRAPGTDAACQSAIAHRIDLLRAQNRQ